jgi:hypothetical protein
MVTWALDPVSRVPPYVPVHPVKEEEVMVIVSSQEPTAPPKPPEATEQPVNEEEVMEVVPNSDSIAPPYSPA